VLIKKNKMKTVLTKFLAISCVSLLMLASCKKDGVLVKSNGGTPGALAANVTTLPLDKTKVSDTTKVITFSFSKANYGYSAAVTNTLQIDVPGDNWAHPTTFTLGTGVLSQGFSTGDFNALLLKLNIPAGVASPVSVRVAHSVAVNVPPVYSNVLALTVTAFNLQSWVYVPGAYEGSNWPNPGPLEDSLYSATDNGIYVGIINFTAGNNQFLIVPVKNWNNKWATPDAASTSGTSSTYNVAYNGSNNFYAPATPGQYLVTLNTNTNQLTIVPADYYTIIGSSTPGGNWSTDLPLKYVNDGSGNWVGSFTLLAGQFKFRQSGQWTNSWGTPQAGTAGAGIPNTLNDTKNDNINATAGTHTVTFTMAATPLGTTPAVTTTYSFQ
jgi:hypothetical protein